MTNKQLHEKLVTMDKTIKSLGKKLGKMDITIKLDEEDLNSMAVKIIARMLNVQTMQTWHDHVRDSPIADSVQQKQLDMTEEEEALGDAAKYMTLMNLFEDKEEYEKCAICKLKLDQINKILQKY